MSENIWKFYCDNDTSGYTLIVPSVAVGNVGQLACDLLISSLNMTKTATIHSPAFIPVLGYDPYDLKSSSLSGSCDIYRSEEKKILVLQLRAPLVHKYAKSFLNELVEVYKKKDIKDIVILTSSFAHEKKHILTSPFRYVASETCPLLSKIFDLKWQQHDIITENGIKIPGGGFGGMFYNICREKSVPCLVLYKYCSEGDNIPDAYEMVHHLNSVLPIFGDVDLLSQLVQPVSWKLLFGGPPPQDIY